MIQVMMIVTAALLVVSSEAFWNLWVCLELFSFFLMPWLMEAESKLSKTNIFFYFIVQFLASVVFLTSSLTLFNKLCSVLLFSSLLMKLSCFPFHSWFVEVVPAISWEKILVLSTLSKLVPLSMLASLMPPKGYIWVLILGLVLTLGGFSVSCLRKLIAYSSVAHSSWFVICACLGKTFSLMYITAYCLTVIPLCFYFMMENLVSIKNALSNNKSKMQFIVMMLAISGIPPFLGFIPKLIVIQTLTYEGILSEAVALGILSVLPVYFYFKLGCTSLGVCSMQEFLFSKPSSLFVIYLMGLSIVSLTLFLLSLSLLYTKTLICQIKESCLNPNNGNMITMVLNPNSAPGSSDNQQSYINMS